MAAPGERPRRVPLYRRGLPVQTGRGGPGPDVRRRGAPEQTNRRFHYLAADTPAKRLSTAFDSVTLYGEDPHERPDVYGKVGNSGVSIATLDDAKKLYSGLRPLRPRHLGVDDHQRPGPDDPRLLHERRHRPGL